MDKETVNCQKEYKVNHNVATGIFRFRLIALLMTMDTQLIIKELVSVFAQKRVARSEKIKAFLVKNQ